jgi:hypothetical protein
VNGAALRASLSSAGAAAFLSGDAQTSVARAVYLDAELAWSRQASVALASSGWTDLHPAVSGEARAMQKLNQAAELVATGSGSTAVAAQVKALLDEADQLHRASVTDWAKYLASAEV